jgi:hypothetical protein
MRQPSSIAQPSPDCALDLGQMLIAGARTASEAEEHLRMVYQQIGHPPSPSARACGSRGRAADAYRLLLSVAGGAGVTAERCQNIWTEVRNGQRD